MKNVVNEQRYRILKLAGKIDAQMEEVLEDLKNGYYAMALKNLKENKDLFEDLKNLEVINLDALQEVIENLKAELEANKDLYFTVKYAQTKTNADAASKINNEMGR